MAILEAGKNESSSDVFVTGKYQVSDPIPVKAGDAPADLYVLAPLTKGTYPVLLFCHGYMLPNTGYQTLLTHIASHGYIVVAPQFYGLFSTMSPTEEISRAAQVAEWLSTGLPAVLPTGVGRDMDNLALSGHSRGGKTAFALALGRVEKKNRKKKTSDNNTPTAAPYKFKALIGVDPVAGFGVPFRQQPRILEYIPRCFDMSIPVAVIGTGLGNQSVTRLLPPMVVPPFAPNGVSHAEFFGESKPPACYFLAKEYGHVDMMDDWVIKWLSWVCKSGAGSKEDMRRSVGGIVVAFLRYYLGGDVRDLNAIVEDPAAAPALLDPSIFTVTLPKKYIPVTTHQISAVPLSVEPAQPVRDPLYQETPKPTFSAAMESCPKKEIPNFKEVLEEENFYQSSEAGEQGRLPVLILKLKETSQKKRPAIVFLHSTNKCKEWLRPLLEAYASRDYITIAIDSRYHGERAKNPTTYQDALVASWKNGDTMPFIFDTVWDLIKLADYLTQREDVDSSRIGITGESLGGMHAWFGSAVDTRYSVVVPIIGVQGFRWAIEHDKWQARVNSIKAVFEEASIDLGKSAIDKEVVEKVWDRIAPGLASRFDSPYSLPAIAPRPLLLLNGEKDARCPIGGLELPESRAREIYEKANLAENFKMVAQPGIWHQMTPLMVEKASEWFDKHLNP